MEKKRTLMNGKSFHRKTPGEVFFRSLLLFSAVIFFLVSCASSAEVLESAEESIGIEEAFPVDFLPEPDAETPGHPAPGDLVFIRAELPFFTAASGVGLLSGESRERSSALSAAEREALSASFKAAYVDGLFREQSLAGVLGADKVHGWPENDPSGWVQNWRTSAPRENAWGIPSLVLAIQSMEILSEMNQGRVFTVHGYVLNHYGKSGGEGGANGGKGYGSPRGEEFFYNGSIAQRFELGLVVIDGEGKGRFLSEAPPSDAALPPTEIGVFISAPPSYGDRIRDAFLSAWKMALDRNLGEMIPDGEGYYLSFENNDALGLAPEYGRVKGIYVQSFNSGSRLLLLPDAVSFPPHARLVTYPFLDALLFTDMYKLPGAEGMTSPEIQNGGAGDFISRLLSGLYFYGLPLSDPMPKRPERSGDEQNGYWQEAQRYSRGWLMSTAFLPDKDEAAE